MAQHYSDPKRARDPYALPDVETFFHNHSGGTPNLGADACLETEDGCPGTGWYWWPCYPGCLPDGDPNGPFRTEADALADARDGCEEEEGD